MLVSSYFHQEYQGFVCCLGLERGWTLFIFPLIFVALSFQCVYFALALGFPFLLHTFINKHIIMKTVRLVCAHSKDAHTNSSSHRHLYREPLWQQPRSSHPLHQQFKILMSMAQTSSQNRVEIVSPLLVSSKNMEIARHSKIH
jgi:hypothetical protein